MKTKNNDNYKMRILRVDLEKERIEGEWISEEVARKYMGGTGLGAKFLMKKSFRGSNGPTPKTA